MTTSAPPLTLTSLLNSLHTHLQTQTQLLPTLHVQLGLPPKALEDELRSLHERLVSSVEGQIDLRRKEVDEWLRKCDSIESECVRYSKALGGNIKATGSSVGELRKEQVLPRRYELVTEYQEKLRQLYHTKLEQLTTLSNRLNALARTLGPEFYAQDIIEPTLANDEAMLDPNAHRDVTPERFSKLEKELVRGKGEVSKRLTQLSATLVQIDWLYSELGMAAPSLEDLPSTSLSSASFFASTSLPRNTNAADPFLAVSTPTPSSRNSSGTSSAHILFPSSPAEAVREQTYQRIFANFVLRIEEADAEDLPARPIPLGLESVDPTPGLLTWAANLHASLEETKRRRETHIQAMYDQLEGLWRRLGVAEGDMDAFVETHRGSTEETVREYEEELERMLELKRERMGMFIESAREEIVRLWDDLMVGEEERAEWAPFVDDEHTEELLTIHEDEIKKLKEERRFKAPLLAGIKKYFEICEEEKELAAAASDQTRLLGRGRDPGRLLREEKMRKRVSKEKPRLEQDLLTSIPTWEQEFGRPFLVHGESMLQLLMETLSANEQENNHKRKQPSPSIRAGSVPARATTPVHSYMPKTGVVTPAVRPASGASNSVPSKRAKIDNGSSNTPSYSGATGRAPFGSHRGGNGASGMRAASPSKIPLSRTTPGSVGARSTTVSMMMPIPKPGTQHHALGHGKVPSGVLGGYGAARSVTSSGAYGAVGSSAAGARYVSAGAAAGVYGGAKKAGRARRESFKPRPSMDGDGGMGVSVGLAMSGRWGFGGVKEEEEC